MTTRSWTCAGKRGVSQVCGIDAATEGGALKAVLYVEYFAESDASEIAASYERLKALVPGIASELHTQPAAMLNAWKLRKAGEPLLHGVTGNRKPITFVEDNAVPVERLSEFVREFRRIVAEHGTVAAYYWRRARWGCCTCGR